MATTYIDTSIFISSIVQGIPLEKLGAKGTVMSSDLLVSEALSVAKREDLSLSVMATFISSIRLLRSQITPESVQTVLSHGYIRGADTHHLATAYAFAGDQPKSLIFLTCDVKQQEIAGKLGFLVR